ncbi:MAG TPA: hypothetical protein DCL16_01210 [Acidimicrobiaceae bacterium]|nr:hypothetical protein [Acidimicrobiaceae bacterium]
MALDPERRRQLHAMKLSSIVSAHLELSVEELLGTDDGASAKLSDGSVAVLAEERHHRALGGALASSARSSGNEVHLFTTDAGDVLARRASLFSGPITVWEIEKDRTIKATPAQPLAETKALGAPELIATLEESGLEVVSEHGVIVGEVEGLEVARIISGDNGDRIDVGVGAHDREAFGLLHGDLPTALAIEQVANVVRSHRVPGAEPHPLNRLGAERWLRAHLISHPEKVGMKVLKAAAPPVERTNLKEAVPAVAKGVSLDGRDTVVVSAVGIDLDLVPFAADARLLHNPEAELKITVPQRDGHQILEDLVDRLVDPAEIIRIEDGWREWMSPPSVP